MVGKRRSKERDVDTENDVDFYKIQKLIDDGNIEQLHNIQMMDSSDDEEVYWIASHLDSEKIIWSSDPKVYAVTTILKSLYVFHELTHN